MDVSRFVFAVVAIAVSVTMLVMYVPSPLNIVALAACGGWLLFCFYQGVGMTRQ